MKSIIFWLYIWGWVLYFIKDILPLGKSIGPLFIIPLLGFSVYSFIYVNTQYNKGFFIKTLDFFLIVTTIYGLQPIINHETIVLGLDENVASYNYLLTIYISFLPIYAIYYFTHKGLINSGRLRNVFILLLIATFVKFIYTYFYVSLLREEDDIVNNVSYFFVPLIPMLYLTNYKQTTKLLFLSLIYVVIILGMKRGPILISTLLFLHFFLLQFLNTRGKARVRVIFSTLLLVSIVSYLAYDFYDNNDFLQMRVEDTLEGKSSGRDTLYETYYDYFVNNTSSIEYMFGIGVNSTLKLFGKYAHNDWLEMAFNQGIFGILLLFNYFIALFASWRKTKIRMIRISLGYIFVIYLLTSLFSMYITNTPLAACICIGFCIACVDTPSVFVSITSPQVCNSRKYEEK